MNFQELSTLCLEAKICLVGPEYLSPSSERWGLGIEPDYTAWAFGVLKSFGFSVHRICLNKAQSKKQINDFDLVIYSAESIRRDVYLALDIVQEDFSNNKPMVFSLAALLDGLGDFSVYPTFDHLRTHVDEILHSKAKESQMGGLIHPSLPESKRAFLQAIFALLLSQACDRLTSIRPKIHYYAYPELFPSGNFSSYNNLYHFKWVDHFGHCQNSVQLGLLRGTI